MNLSKAAFSFTRQTFHDVVEGGYFWTFTFPVTLEIKEACKRWNHFLVLLKREYPGVFGFRVFELHPGGHGLHVHFVCNLRLPVRRLRELSDRAGFGRIHVVEIEGADMLAVTEYLGKYLSKSRPEALKGRRLWAPFGDWPEATTKVREIKKDTLASRVFACLRGKFGWDSCAAVHYRHRMALLEHCMRLVAWHGFLPGNPLYGYGRALPEPWANYWDESGPENRLPMYLPPEWGIPERGFE